MREKLERVSFTSDAAQLAFAETLHDGTERRAAGGDIRTDGKPRESRAGTTPGNVVKNPVISRANKDPAGYTQTYTLPRCLLAVFPRELGINSAII